MTREVMLKLKSKFQKEIFTRIIERYHSSLNTEKILKIPASSIRGYKNLYFDSIPEKVVEKIIELNISDALEIRKNTVSCFFKDQQIARSLEYGRLKRNEIIKSVHNSIPSVSELICKGRIDVLKWFKQYFNLLNTGFRKAKFSVEKDRVVVGYTNFAGSCFKEFKVNLPRYFRLDGEFIYFFGLWCGDRAGGKRFGICNKNPEIIKLTEKFLDEHFQYTQRYLYVSELINAPQVSYDKKYILKTDKKGWVLSVHSQNGILSSFFKYLLRNLDELLSLIDPRPFFAGLFDAEGNVSLYNKSFRLACKNTELVQIYRKYLKKLNLYSRYEGNCLVTYNLRDFSELILPFMKHLEKINLSYFMLEGRGPIPGEYLDILHFLKNNPLQTNKEIAKALKKVKVYSELKILSNFDFISGKGYPFKFEITSKGLKSLGD